MSRFVAVNAPGRTPGPTGRHPDRLRGPASRPALRMLDSLEAGVVRRCRGGVECAPCEAEQLGAQRQATGAAVAEGVPASVQETVRDPGQPLDPAVRDMFEARFGHDFGEVRVHTGALASASTGALAARAYTVGRHIVFGPGAYTPDGHQGRRLLAHELAHVVQQRDGAGAAPLQVGRADDPAEREAEAAAGSVMDAVSPDRPPAVRAVAAAILRQVDPAAAGRERCCERKYPGAIPIWWPAPNWHPTIGDPGAKRPEFNRPTEPLLIKEGSGLYDPSRPEIGRYDRIISSPPFNLERPAGWPIHHKVPLMLGGWGDKEEAAGSYGPSGEVLVAPNLVVMKPDAHQAWHRVLTEQPRGPRHGKGPSGATPEGTTFCVLDLMPRSCREDEGDDLREDQLARAAMMAGRELSERLERRAASRAGRAAARPAAAAGEAAAVGGASRLGGLLRVAGRVAAKASLVITIADVVLSAASALASYTYGSVYSGTRGARLEETLKQLGLNAQALADEGSVAVELEELVTLVSEAEPSPESSTAGLRQEWFEALVRLRGTVYDLGLSLDEAARGYSAIRQRIERSGFDEAKLAIDLADSLIQGGDTSALSLSMLAYHLVDAGSWYATHVERLFDDYKALVRDDFGAWMEQRR